MTNTIKNIAKGFVVIFTFGTNLSIKKNNSNKIANYWFKTGNYINNSFKTETSK
mgnify:CR=1 FL=1